MAVALRTGTTPGAAPTGYSPAYGGIPQVPNLIDVYGTSTSANQSMLPQFTNIGSTVTAANQQELLNNLRASIPGYDASVAKSSQNIGALQKGEIPPDVIAQLQQQGAERGISTGFYDSPNANAAIMRALGLTSLGLEGEGEKQMTSLVGRTPQAQPFDVSKLMMSPTDLYESQLLANTYKAAPVPEAAARQLISDQMAGYNLGRGGNVPSYSSSGPSMGGGGPPMVADRPRYDPGNPAAVGALGPFPSAPAPITVPRGNLQAGGGAGAGLEWDPQMGAYWNKFTNSYVTPEEDSSSWITSGMPSIQDPSYPDMYGADPTLDPGASFDEFLGGE